MPRLPRTLILVLVAVLVVSGLAGFVQPAPASAEGPPKGKVPNKYIVQLREGVDPDEKRKDVKGDKPDKPDTKHHVFHKALNGFTIELSDEEAEALREDPDVLSVSPDYYIGVTAELMPTGIKRSDGDLNAHTQINRNPTGVEVDAGIAIVDSGIDLDHPDLNVVGGVNCATDGTSADDLNGHGTHVAGTAAAKDNDISVVGVAPGARLYAVRVLAADGTGEFSNAICGLEWVLANSADIDVANLSFGGVAPEGNCTDGSLRQAVCNVVAAGITVVVAAGNGGEDAVGDDVVNVAPANFDEAITVSAIVDTDGHPGSTGFDHFFWGPDDSLASFSNYGADVDIAAPGVQILSTWPGGENYSDGTSMATPHVSGAAAIVRAMNPGMSPADVKSAILAVAWPQASADGFTGDTDGFAEPVLNLGALGGDPLPPIPASCTLAQTSGLPGTMVNVSCDNFDANETVRIYWDVASGTARGVFTANASGSGSGSFSVPTATTGAHNVIMVGQTSGKQVTLQFTVLNYKLTTTTVAGADFLSGFVGDTIRVKLTEWQANAEVTIQWYGAVGFTPTGTPTVMGTTTVDAAGNGFLDIIVPDAARGFHVVEGFIAGTSPLVKAHDPFNVMPRLAISPTTAVDGDTITTTLQGFDANDTVALRFYADFSTFTVVGSVTTNATGNGTGTFQVPIGSTNGQHKVEGQGTNAAAKASANLLVDNPPGALPADCTLNPVSGIAGMEVDISCENYEPGEVVNIYWNDTASTALGSFTADVDGAGTATITIPADATTGMHDVLTENAGGTESTTDSFEVLVGPDCTLTPESGSVGTSLTVSCTGFKPNELVAIYWDITTAGSRGVFTADATGAGSATFAVPTTSGGAHNVISKALVSGWQTTDVFTIDATMAVNSTSGGPGTVIKIDLFGFGASEQVKIEFVDSLGAAQGLTTVTMMANGSRTVFIGVPSTPRGDYLIRATGLSSGTILEAPYTVLATISHISKVGNPGNYVTFTFKGYLANESIQLVFVHGFGEADQVIGTVVADAKGTAVTTVVMPPAGRGFHVIKGVGNGGTTTQSQWEVIPNMTSSRWFGTVGMTINLTFDGWARNTAITIRWYETESVSSPSVVLGTVMTDNFGHAAFSLTVPEAAAKFHRLESVGGGNVRWGNFYIQTSMLLSPMQAPAGANVALTLRGFGANEQIELRFFTNTADYIVLTTLTADANGSVNTTFAVPASTKGIHKIQTFGLTSGVQALRWFYLT